MLSKEDSIAGLEGIHTNVSSDPLLDGNDFKTKNSLNNCIKPFLELTPLEFNDTTFIEATLHLNGCEFAKAAYRVYLRRECEIPSLKFGDDFLVRMQTIGNFRQSPEFLRLWSKQIEMIREKNSRIKQGTWLLTLLKRISRF